MLLRNCLKGNHQQDAIVCFDKDSVTRNMEIPLAGFLLLMSYQNLLNVFVKAFPQEALY